MTDADNQGLRGAKGEFQRCGRDEMRCAPALASNWRSARRYRKDRSDHLLNDLAQTVTCRSRHVAQAQNVSQSSSDPAFTASLGDTVNGAIGAAFGAAAGRAAASAG